MSQIAITIRLVTTICAVLLVMMGCGTPNEKSPFDSDAQKHAASWIYNGHAAAAQARVSECTACHGEDLQGGISLVSCSECHPDGPSPMTGCTSCHEKPPVTGGHSAHKALPSVAGVCATCHSGAGSMTVKHFNTVVEVDFPSVYNAKSGTAARNADGTCSSISCHGGQTTPAWQIGTITVNAACGSCHAFGSAEYNSYVSGRHDIHVNERRFPCSHCHDAQLLAVNHFTNLNTAVMEGPASATLKSDLNYTIDFFGGSCLPLCHGTKRW